MTFQISARIAASNGVNSRLVLKFLIQITCDWGFLIIIANACSSEYLGSWPLHVRTVSKRRLDFRYVGLRADFFIPTMPSTHLIKEYVGELIFEPTFTSREWVSRYFLNISYAYHDHQLVGSQRTRVVPTCLSSIQLFRWIVVRRGMKPGTSTTALPRIVAVLVRLSFFFLSR